MAVKLKLCGTLALSLTLLGCPVSAANLTSLVNLFIGTASGANGGSGGNAFPGAAIPHAMVKVCRTISLGFSTPLMRLRSASMLTRSQGKPAILQTTLRSLVRPNNIFLSVTKRLLIHGRHFANA